jgi:tyrosine-protein phosphatase SIW14
VGRFVSPCSKSAGLPQSDFELVPLHAWKDAMPVWFRWGLGLTIVAMILAVPFIHFRATFAHSKRLREVTPARFYRCGQLTAAGFREAFERYGIRAVINLQHEATDPALPESYYRVQPSILESDICQQYGVRYFQINVETVTRGQAEKEPVKVIDEYRAILDDPANYPVLLHCKAGLHRTGLLTAIYRMEYERWPKSEATRELRANGFGEFACTTADDYVYELVYLYEPRWRRKAVNQGALGDADDPRTKKEGNP